MTTFVFARAGFHMAGTLIRRGHWHHSEIWLGHAAGRGGGQVGLKIFSDDGQVSLSNNGLILRDKTLKPRAVLDTIDLEQDADGAINTRYLSTLALNGEDGTFLITR